jgi:hypothetical protein
VTGPGSPEPAGQGTAAYFTTPVLRISAPVRKHAPQ